MTGILERHKQDAMGFYDMMFNQCRPADAIAGESANGNSTF